MVPLPKNGSKTTSPLFDEATIILFKHLFLIDKFDGLSNSGVISALAAVVLIYSSRNVGSGAGVEGAIEALNYVDVPHHLPCATNRGGSTRSLRSLAHRHPEQAKTSPSFSNREVFARRRVASPPRCVQFW